MLESARHPSEPLPPLPESLAGAMPDLTFEIDSDGNLIPNPETRNIFDFFLAGLEDEPLELVLTRLEQMLANNLGEPALGQARDLLQRYLDYRIRMDGLTESAQPVMTSSGFDLAALRQRQNELTALRQGSFSASEAEAFFGLEAVQDRYMLEYLAISQDPNLSERARTSALADLDAQLPAPIRDIRQRVTRNGQLYQQVRQMRLAGASTAEVYQTRAEALGDEAASRLAELDQQRAKWQQRLQDFVRERDNIRQSGLSPSDQQQAIDQLIGQRFSGPEVVRVQALSAEL